MKIWRKLNKCGAVQFKGAAYLLPDDKDHYEFFDWLVSEVSSLGGEAALIKTARVENMKDHELIRLFNDQRESDYKKPARSIQNLARKFDSIEKGSKAPDAGTLKSQFNKCRKEFEEVHSLDFFASKTGTALYREIEELRRKIASLAADNSHRRETVIAVKNAGAYQGKTWVTRPHPFVDRMATAWLIRKFIDADAAFGFAEEVQSLNHETDAVNFDVRGGVFTHIGDMCTFEVMLKTFDLKDKKLRKIAEIVHDLDMKDDKFASAEAKGLENILTGIRNSAGDDSEALEKGMAVFEMLYASLT